MFSELNAPANRRKRGVLIGSWLLHAALWLAFALFALMLRGAVLAETPLLRADPSDVLLRVQQDQLIAQGQALSRFFIFGCILCLGLGAMALVWAWQLAHQRLRAWRVGIAWLGLEYMAFCAVGKLISSAATPQGDAQPSLLSGDQRWMIGFLVLQMLVMFAIPFIHLWARRAYELRPGEHSDAQRFKWWLEALGERLMRRLFKRQQPQPPISDQRPAPPPIPEDIERRHMWPSAPLPPASDLPPDDHFRS
ncbi:MAG TPA: hypothetical protein VGE07_08480 [Herpetosiphonaceae bacterium]